MKILKEIYQEIKRLEGGPKKLRSFGLIVGGLLLALAFYLAIFRDPTLVWLWMIGALLMILGAVSPRLLRLPYIGWMSLALILGFFVSRIILIVLFYLILTPLGLARQLIKGDFLNQKINKKRKSYWIKYKKQDKAADFEQLY